MIKLTHKRWEFATIKKTFFWLQTFASWDDVRPKQLLYLPGFFLRTDGYRCQKPWPQNCPVWAGVVNPIWMQHPKGIWNWQIQVFQTGINPSPKKIGILFRDPKLLPLKNAWKGFPLFPLFWFVGNWSKGQVKPDWLMGRGSFQCLVYITRETPVNT